MKTHEAVQLISFVVDTTRERQQRRFDSYALCVSPTHVPEPAPSTHASSSAWSSVQLAQHAYDTSTSSVLSLQQRRLSRYAILAPTSLHSPPAHAASVALSKVQFWLHVTFSNTTRQHFDVAAAAALSAAVAEGVVALSIIAWSRLHVMSHCVCCVTTSSCSPARIRHARVH